jgi:hypothetical protein
LRTDHALVSALAGSAMPMLLDMRSAVTPKLAARARPARAISELAYEGWAGNARAAATSLVNAALVSPLVSDSRAFRNSARAAAAESDASTVLVLRSAGLLTDEPCVIVCAASAEGEKIRYVSAGGTSAMHSPSWIAATMRVVMHACVAYLP